MEQTEKKLGLFISHITDEKAAANKLKGLLRQAFGKEFGVFVSSDYVSIPGGDPWFTEQLPMSEGGVGPRRLCSDQVTKWLIWNFAAMLAPSGPHKPWALARRSPS